MSCKNFECVTAASDNNDNVIIHCTKGDYCMSNQQAENVMDNFCRSDDNCHNCNYYNKADAEPLEQTTSIAKLQENTEVSADVKEAIQEHYSVLESYRTAANAIVTMGKGLKAIRDKKLYAKLGYNTFAEYLENNGDYTFKERQAYTYIKLYEDNSTQFLEAHANLGVTKLELLSKLPGYEREEFVESNDLAGMTVDEIRQLIKDKQDMGEQLSLFQGEIAQLKTENEESLENMKDIIKKLNDELSELKKNNSDVKTHYFDKSNELKKAESKIAELSDELEKAQNMPRDVAVREPDERELEQIKLTLKAEIQQEHDAEIEKLRATQQKEIDELKTKYAEREESEKQELENKLKSGNADETRIALKVLFTNTQQALSEFIAKVKDVADTKTKEKFVNGTLKWLEIVESDLKEVR